jgi:hypothetical protein
VVSEALHPDLIEHWAIALQCPHDNPYLYDVGQVGAGGGQDRGEVGEQLLCLFTGSAGIAWDFGSSPNTAET